LLSLGFISIRVVHSRFDSDAQPTPYEIARLSRCATDRQTCPIGAPYHAAANIEPLIATGRQPHHPSWRERFAAPPPAPENPTPVEAMAWLAVSRAVASRHHVVGNSPSRPYDSGMTAVDRPTISGQFLGRFPRSQFSPIS
jgi:hypothetical protein